MSMGRKFRELLKENEYIVTPGITTPLHVSLAGLRLTMQPFWDYAVDMRERGAEAEFDLEQRLAGHPMADIFAFEGFPQIRELEAKYLPADALDLRYGTAGRGDGKA